MVREIILKLSALCISALTISDVFFTEAIADEQAAEFRFIWGGDIIRGRVLMPHSDDWRGPEVQAILSQLPSQPCTIDNSKRCVWENNPTKDCQQWMDWDNSLVGDCNESYVKPETLWSYAELYEDIPAFDVNLIDSGTYDKILSEIDFVNRYGSLTLRFVKADLVERGQIYFRAIQRISDIRPNVECFPVGCAKIIKTELNVLGIFRQAYLQCTLYEMDEISPPPKHCTVIAFESRHNWYILAVTGPANQGNIGGGFFTGCIIPTAASVEQVITAVSQVASASPTEIELRTLRSKSNSVVLAGEVRGKDSKFFSGYYEKARLLVGLEIFDDPDFDESRVEVQLDYSILISAEPTQDGVNYHEIDIPAQDNPADWLLLRIQEHFLSGLSPKFSGVTCQDEGYF